VKHHFTFYVKVTIEIQYSLIERMSRKEIIKEVIVTSYRVVKGNDLFRLAREGSAQKNIFIFMDVLSKLIIDNEQASVVD